MPDNRVVFHFNKAHNADQSVPPWVVKHRGETFYVHHFKSDVGFDTKETPDSSHTKGSLQMRGIFRVFYEPGGIKRGHVYRPEMESSLAPQDDPFYDLT